MRISWTSVCPAFQVMTASVQVQYVHFAWLLMRLLHGSCTWLACTTGIAGSINGAYPKERKFPFDQVCEASFTCMRSFKCSKFQHCI